MTLHQFTKNYDRMMYGCLVIAWDRQMDRLTDGKSDKKKWVPHLKKNSLTDLDHKFQNTLSQEHFLVHPSASGTNHSVTSWCALTWTHNQPLEVLQKSSVLELMVNIHENVHEIVLFKNLQAIIYKVTTNECFGNFFFNDFDHSNLATFADAYFLEPLLLKNICSRSLFTQTNMLRKNNTGLSEL